MPTHSLAPGASARRERRSTDCATSRSPALQRRFASLWCTSPLEKPIARSSGSTRRSRRGTGRWPCSTSNQPLTPYDQISGLPRLSSASGFHDRHPSFGWHGHQNSNVTLNRANRGFSTIVGESHVAPLVTGSYVGL